MPTTHLPGFLMADAHSFSSNLCVSSCPTTQACACDLPLPWHGRPLPPWWRGLATAHAAGWLALQQTLRLWSWQSCSSADSLSCMPYGKGRCAYVDLLSCVPSTSSASTTSFLCICVASTCSLCNNTRPCLAWHSCETSYTLCIHATHRR